MNRKGNILSVKKKPQARKTRWLATDNIRTYIDPKKVQFNKGYEEGYHECKKNYEDGYSLLKKEKQELEIKIIAQKFEQTKQLLSVFGQSIQAMADLLRRAKE